MVQCGVCGMVFDALLNSIPDDTTPHDVSPLPVNDQPGPDLIDEPAAHDSEPVDAAPAETPPAYETTLSATEGKLEVTEETQLADEQLTVISKSEAVNTAPVLSSIQFTKKHSRKRASLEFGLALVFLMLLAVQFSILYRDQLAANVPHIAPALNTLCALSNCQIKLPADKNLIKIINTSLEVDPKNPDLISVHIGLENQSDTAIAYPNIALSLTNDDDEVLVRKNFNQ